MRADGFLPALSVVINAFFLVAGVYVYVSLLRQIRSRITEPELIPVRQFAWPEAVLATFLSLFFLMNLLAGSATENMPKIGDRQLIGNAVFTMGLLLAVAGFCAFAAST